MGRRQGRTRSYGTVSTRREPTPGRLRWWSARVAVAFGVVLVAVSAMSPPAAATYPRIAATVGCDRVVEWRASAATAASTEARTNPRVQVEWRAVGDEAAWQDAGPVGRFDEAGGFEFSGTIELPDGVDEIDIRVSALAPWANGDEPGAPRFAKAAVPDVCDDVPLAVRVAVDCDAAAATVQLRSLDRTTRDVAVTVNRIVVRELEIGGEEQDVVVPLLAGRSSALRVLAGDTVMAERNVGGTCAASGPVAMVLERCGPGDAVVQAASPSPGELRVFADGEPVISAPISSDVVQRTLALPAGGVDLRVEVDGEVLAVGSVGGCDGRVTGLLSCGPGRTPCALPDSPDNGDAIPAPAPVTPPPTAPPTGGEPEPELAHTGPWDRGLSLALGGLLLAVGGLAMSRQHRPGRAPTQLDVALAPYRTPDDR